MDALVDSILAAKITVKVDLGLGDDLEVAVDDNGWGNMLVCG